MSDEGFIISPAIRAYLDEFDRYLKGPRLTADEIAKEQAFQAILSEDPALRKPIPRTKSEPKPRPKPKPIPMPAAKERKELSPRQKEILGLRVRSLDLSEIADQLWISKKTVERHMTAIHDSLGTDGSPFVLAGRALELEVVTPEELAQGKSQVLCSIAETPSLSA